MEFQSRHNRRSNETRIAAQISGATKESGVHCWNSEFIKILARASPATQRSHARQSVGFLWIAHVLANVATKLLARSFSRPYVRGHREFCARALPQVYEKSTQKCTGNGVPAVSIFPAAPSARRKPGRANSGFSNPGILTKLMCPPKHVCNPAPHRI